MAIKNTPGQLPLKNLFFHCLVGLHNWSAASISRAPSTRGTWASQNRFRETPWKIKRLPLVLWQKTESWGSPWRGAGRFQGDLTIACQYIRKFIRQKERDFSPRSAATPTGAKDLNYKTTALYWMQGKEIFSVRMWQYTGL